MTTDAGSGHGPRLPRRIAHFDLDTFFVAVARLDDPSLIGRPVLVGFDGPRGVVSSASYEARQYGCHSAQPMAEAKRLCPQAAVVSSAFGRYSELSEAFHELLSAASPVVESAGIDEAYADLTGLGDRRHGAAAVGERVRDEVRERLGITVSACIAGSRVTAKVGSDRAKPDGLIEVPVGGDAAFLAPLPLRELPLVGPRFGEQLRVLGVRTIGEAAALDRAWLEQRFGRAGALLADRARGIDGGPVRAHRRSAKSVSREMTFGQDVTDRVELERTLAGHAERVGADLRRAGRRARTVTLKLRWSDFETVTRSRTVDRPVQASARLAQVGVELLAEVAPGGLRPVRLIGLGATNLVDDAVQLGFEDAITPPGGVLEARSALRDEQLDHALDDIRSRFGGGAVSRGRGASERRGFTRD